MARKARSVVRYGGFEGRWVIAPGITWETGTRSSQALGEMRCACKASEVTNHLWAPWALKRPALVRLLQYLLLLRSTYSTTM